MAKMKKRIKKRLDKDVDSHIINNIMHLSNKHIPKDVVRRLKKLLMTSNSNVEYIVANFIKNVFEAFKQQI